MRTNPNRPRGCKGELSLSRWFGAALCGALLGGSGALAAEGDPTPPESSDLVKQANAPISSILQVRFQDSYVPKFTGVSGQGNTFSIAHDHAPPGIPAPPGPATVPPDPPRRRHGAGAG